MTKEQFLALEDYIKSIIDFKLYEAYPATGDYRKAVEKSQQLRHDLLKVLASTCQDLK